uniref:Alcohol dehydrogenase-like N-terminal domain-containing protein n=2 Tax=Aegilops tauschii subsp. strangulata TaxID=200361 RepID=A0A453IDQ2_AEGTS
MMMVVATASPGGPEALQVREVEDLSAPGEGKLLVRVAAAGVNRDDTVQRQGRYSPPSGASPYPGLECSGTIVALGANAPRAGPSTPGAKRAPMVNLLMAAAALNLIFFAYDVAFAGVHAAYRRRVCGEGCGSGGAASTDDRGGVAD